VQKIVSKYALAAHLAILAVAPLFLLPFAGERPTGVVMFWLVAFGFIWLCMEPSRRKGEMPHNARERVGRAMLRDPLFWFSVVLVAYAGFRSVNGGIGLGYDAELMVWSIRQSVWTLFPGCVGEAGFLPFAMVLTLVIIIQSMLHALGRSARVAFLFVSSVGSALAALALAFAVSYGHQRACALAMPSVHDASYFGTAFGIQLLVSLVAFFSVVGEKWIKVEPLAGLATVGNAIGLVTFAPTHVLLVFAAAFVVLTVTSFALTRHVIERAASFRCALVVLTVSIAAVLYAIASENAPGMAERIASIKSLEPFPKDFRAMRESLSAIAVQTWKANPWIGTGLASFPLDIRFAAVAHDWEVFGSTQVTALNGWWQLLAERGVIGALMIAITVGMLLWTAGARLVASFRSVRILPEHLLGFMVLLALVALAFVDCSYLRPEVLLLAGAVLSLSCGAFPSRKSTGGDERGN